MHARCSHQNELCSSVGPAWATAAGVCNKIQLLPQSCAQDQFWAESLAPRKGPNALSWLTQHSTKLFALSHHSSPPDPGLNRGPLDPKSGRLHARPPTTGHHIYLMKGLKIGSQPRKRDPIANCHVLIAFCIYKHLVTSRECYDTKKFYCDTDTDT